MTESNRNLQQWAEAARTFRLPEWETLPPLELYMDQVVILLNRYLGGEENAVTPAMINNYVKMALIPRPQKKKYSRIHLAALIMVCSLKNTHSIATIRTLLPDPMTEEAMQATYAAYTAEHAEASQRFAEALLQQNEDPKAVIIRAAVEAELGRSLTAYMGGQ